jgi:hypothetical protein
MSCKCNKVLPPTGTMIATAVKAAARTVQGAMAGKDVLAPPETAAARMAACMACDNLITAKNGKNHRCSICGCWLDGNVLCKSCLAAESCPIGKW